MSLQVRFSCLYLVVCLAVLSMFLLYTPSSPLHLALHSPSPSPLPSSLNELVMIDQFPNISEDRIECVSYTPGRGEYSYYVRKEEGVGFDKESKLNMGWEAWVYNRVQMNTERAILMPKNTTTTKRFGKMLIESCGKNSNTD